MDKKAYFFSHKECEYFPCHRTDNPEEFNCLFCFCPLYPFKDCGGRFTITERGVKSCLHCLIPHTKKGYFYVTAKLKEMALKNTQSL